MPVIYGIANCDSVRRARAWLAAHRVEAAFHDFKKAGVPAKRLDAWMAALGWERLLNRKGTAWRQLDDAARGTVVDGATASALMQAQPSVIKRPVVEWNDAMVTVGFDGEAWERALEVSRPRG